MHTFGRGIYKERVEEPISVQHVPRGLMHVLGKVYAKESSTKTPRDKFLIPFGVDMPFTSANSFPNQPAGIRGVSTIELLAK